MHRLVNLKARKPQNLGKPAFFSFSRTSCYSHPLPESLLPESDLMLAKNVYLMGSLVALSLTVEEKEECVLSSNRKDNAAFAVSEADKEL